jgi:AcrR family transcriptional regulator
MGRVHLMDATGELMAERGTIDVSIHDIARRSGMSSALIKYHFGHKDGLLLAVLERVVGDSILRLEKLVERDIPPADKLRLHIEGVLYVYSRYPYVNRLMHYLLSTGEDARMQVSHRIVKPLFAAQARILAEGYEKGVFRQVDPMNFYFQVIGACDHLFFGHYALRYAFDIEEICEPVRRRYVRDLVATILGGIAVH